MPVTHPVVGTIAPREGAAILHAPPVVTSLKQLVLPTQIFGLPVIVAGIGFTVTLANVLLHPEPMV